ncbi:MAG: DUF2587 domain-containing protein [bacterium]|nr:DUF2587 domain-containing protein [bacterium]
MADIPQPVPVEPTEVIREGPLAEGDSDEPLSAGEAIEQPAKVMRVGTMMKQLLDEVRQSSLDESSRDRLRDIYATSIEELGSALSPDLREELDRLILPFPEDHPPSQAELQVAKAQLVGWLEGLIQGIQAALFAQQVSAQQQLANIRAELPPGVQPPTERRPGTYL